MGPRGTEQAISPTCTPGPRPTCPVPVGWGWTRPRACSPARGTSRSPARRIPSSSAAPVSGFTDVCESTLRFRDGRHPHPRRSAGHQAVQRCSMDRRCGTLGDARSTASSPMRDVRLTMGGEPTFVSIDDMEGEEWNYTAHWARKSSSSPSSLLLPPEASASLRGAPGAFWPGQVVSGRAAASLVAQPASGARSDGVVGIRG